MSSAVHGANGTMSLIGLSGKEPWAKPGIGRAAAAKGSARRVRRFMNESPENAADFNIYNKELVVVVSRTPGRPADHILQVNCTKWVTP
jgi:hypothetical protein